MGAAPRDVPAHAVRRARARAHREVRHAVSFARRSEGRCRFLVALFLLGVAVVFARPARAQDPPPARRVVELLIAGNGEEGLEDTVRELLGRLALITESQNVGHVDADDPSFRSTAKPSLLARVGIDLSPRDAVTILIVDGRTGDVAVRRSVKRDASPAVLREEVAHVVESAIDPMLAAERDRQNSPPPPPPPPAPTPPPIASVPPEPDLPPPPPPATAESPLSLDVVTAAGAGSFAPGAGVVARAGGGATLVWRRGLRPGIALAADYVFPFETGDDTASAHVNAFALRAVPSIEVYANHIFAFDLLAGVGLDVLRVEPRTNELPAELLGRTVTRVDPLFTGGINTHLAISGGTSASLMLGADIDTTSREWIVVGGTATAVTFSPSRVRPIAMLGFTFTAFGESRFGATR